MTDDGQQIYFTSRLVLKSSPGEGRIAEGRLYRLAADGVSLMAERGARAVPSQFSSEIGVEYPQVSADGSVIAFTFVNTCPEVPPAIRSQCVPVDVEGALRGKQSLDLGRGTVQLSRNGRWALLTTRGSTSPESTLIDLRNGERTSIPNPAFGSYLSTVASDGTILIEQRDMDNYPTFGLWKQGSITPVTTTNVAPVAISDDARVALLSWPDYQFSGVFTQRMGLKDLSTGQETMFYERRDEDEWAAFMGMSGNGSRVLYRRMPDHGEDGEAYVYDLPAGKSLPVALPAGESVSDGTLSASGEFAVLATSAGRLVKVNLADNTIATLIPATPYVPYLDGLVPGSLFHLTRTLSGGADDWAGRISLDGRPVPVVKAHSGDVAIQVPWNQALGVVPFRFDPGGDTPFLQFQAASVLPAAPLLERVSPGETAILNRVIVRGDWSGLVDKPPAAGDVIHLYMTGLGPVAGSPQTGVPTPSGTLYPITGKIGCGFNASFDLDASDNWAAETLFAGLAPGTIGLYQVSLRLPANEPSELRWIVCQVLLPNGYRSTVID